LGRKISLERPRGSGEAKRKLGAWNYLPGRLIVVALIVRVVVILVVRASVTVVVVVAIRVKRVILDGVVVSFGRVCCVMLRVMFA